jgi:hypothetical protein
MKMLKFIHLIIATSLLTSCSSKEAPFQSLQDGLCSENQRSLVSDHISSQISAISKQDWPLAYSFAAKSFQDSVDLSSFERIITRSYQILINNKEITFGKCQIENSGFFQEVIVNSSYEKVELLYKLSFVDQKLGVQAADITEQSSALTT